MKKYNVNLFRDSSNKKFVSWALKGFKQSSPLGKFAGFFFQGACKKGAVTEAEVISKLNALYKARADYRLERRATPKIMRFAVSSTCPKNIAASLKKNSDELVKATLEGFNITNTRPFMQRLSKWLDTTYGNK